MGGGGNLLPAMVVAANRWSTDGEPGQETWIGPGARMGRRPVGGHPLLPSSFLAAAGNKTPEAGLAQARPARRSPYLQLIRVTRARNAVLGGGSLSWKRDTGR